MKTTHHALDMALATAAISFCIAPALGAQELAFPSKAAPNKQRSVDLAICLDTSGSMRGLIDSARQSIWSIVNDLALAKPAPRLRIALLTYGNDGHAAANGWVRVDTKFTQDLDLVSEKMFALETNGGTELVGRVLQASLKQLEWTASSDGLKLIVVAGNESADQDRMVDFRTQCKAAIARGIMINSIYCGNPSDNLAPVWRSVAKLADGHFDAIDQNGTIALKSPFDAQISSLSSALNTTYIPIGVDGRRKQAGQIAQDVNASGLNSQAAAQRGQTKCSANYYCAWDLLDNIRTKKVTLSDVKTTDLPANMRKMSMAAREAYVAKMQKKRASIKKQVNDLNTKRQTWCKQELEKRNQGKTDTFESAVRKSVRSQAAAKGLHFEAAGTPPAKESADDKSTVRKLRGKC